MQGSGVNVQDAERAYHLFQIFCNSFVVKTGMFSCTRGSLLGSYYLDSVIISGCRQSTSTVPSFNSRGRAVIREHFNFFLVTGGHFLHKDGRDQTVNISQKGLKRGVSRRAPTLQSCQLLNYVGTLQSSMKNPKTGGISH